jgi:hypothetical protein
LLGDRGHLFRFGTVASRIFCKFHTCGIWGNQ